MQALGVCAASVLSRAIADVLDVPAHSALGWVLAGCAALSLLIALTGLRQPPAP